MSCQTRILAFITHNVAAFIISGQSLLNGQGCVNVCAYQQPPPVYKTQDLAITWLLTMWSWCLLLSPNQLESTFSDPAIFRRGPRIMLIISVKLIRRPRRGCVSERKDHASDTSSTTVEALGNCDTKLARHKHQKHMSLGSRCRHTWTLDG